MSEDRTKYIRNNAKKSVILAMELIKELPNLVKSEENLYIFNGKHYDILDNYGLECKFNDFVLKYGIIASWKSQIINEVIKFIKSYSDIATVEMNSNTNLLCLNNGVLNTDTMEFFPHSKDYYFDTNINIDYNAEDKDCPVFVKYIKEVFNDNREMINNIIRLGGYLLDYSTDNMRKCNKIFIFNGPGGAGKSTLLDAFRLLFSRKQITSLSLEELSGDGFKNAQLLYSRVNISGEQKRKRIDAESIKLISEGSDLTIRPIYKEAITFKPKTKLIIACNGKPTFSDSSEGIYRRLAIFEFKNQYKNDYEYNREKNPESKCIFKQDRQLFSKIEKEKVAIFNLFLEGLKILREDNFQFLEGTNFAETMEEFKNDNDSAREFLKEKYIVDNESFIPVKEVYAEFRVWHNENVGGRDFKFRSNEMGKRIKEVFSVGSNGQRLFKNINGEVEYLRTYPLKKIKYEFNTDGDISISSEGESAIIQSADTQPSFGLRD